MQLAQPRLLSPATAATVIEIEAIESNSYSLYIYYRNLYFYFFFSFRLPVTATCNGMHFIKCIFMCALASDNMFIVLIGAHNFPEFIAGSRGEKRRARARSRNQLMYNSDVHRTIAE